MSQREVVTSSDIPRKMNLDFSDADSFFRFLEERLPKPIVPEDASRSAPIRVHALFPVGQRKKCRVLQEDELLKWMPNRLLPVYMDPFLIAAPADCLPRAVYGFTLVDSLLEAYIKRENLGSSEAKSSAYRGVRADRLALRHLSKRFGINLQLAACHHAPGNLVLALACNHELAAVPEGIKEKAWDLLKLLQYPASHEPLWFLELDW